MSKEERIEYLEDERKKLWKNITEIEERLSKKTSDYENEAKLASERASIFKNSSEEASTTIVQNLEEANSKLAEIKTAYVSYEKLNTEIQEFSKNSKANSELIKTIYDGIESKSALIQNQILEIEKIFATKPILDEKILKLGEIFTKGDDYDSKLSSLHKQITERKKEIDELYYKIIGYTEPNKEGVETKVKGLKDELQDSYTQTKLKLDELDKDLTTFKTNTKSEYEKFVEEKQNTWEQNFDTLFKKIEGLLPGATSTGLATAYKDQRKSYIAPYWLWAAVFVFTMGGMIWFAVATLSASKDVDEALMKMLSRIPFFIPAFWLAIFASKQQSQNKRLQQEYAYKETLTKSYEADKREIEKLPESEEKNKLSAKLLEIMIDMAKNNPSETLHSKEHNDRPPSVLDILKMKAVKKFTGNP